MRFLVNIPDPDNPLSKQYLALPFIETLTPQKRKRAWERHLEGLRGKVIGEPQETGTYTSAQLKEMGLVGVYTTEGEEVAVVKEKTVEWLLRLGTLIAGIAVGVLLSLLLHGK